MSLITILIISLASALFIGIFGGMFIGRYLRKRRENKGYELLSAQQRIVSLVSVLVGIALLIVGVVVVPKISKNSINVEDSISVEGEIESDTGTSGGSGGGRSGGSVSMSPRGGSAVVIG